MAPRTVDVVAAGPPSPDLYDPAASAWALAAGLAARGHSVQVTFPGPGGSPPAPAGVTVAPFPPVTAHVGSFLGDAELARSAGHRIRPGADLVVRDPSGLGALGHRAGRHALVSFVRTLAAEGADEGAAGPVAGRLASKLSSWGQRRGVRRLEREALAEATVVYCANAGQRERLRNEYDLPSERLRVGPPAVAHGPEAPTREAARRLVGVPDDILLVALLPPVDPGDAVAVAPALEAFRRTRPIFPGARLAVVGVPGPAAPGVVALPSREADVLTAAVMAADVAVAFTPPSTVDPGLVFALRAGLPTVVGPQVDLGEGTEGAVRRAPATDAGELASVLAELLADPEERHALGEGARAFARRFDPERLAGELETVVGTSAG